MSQSPTAPPPTGRNPALPTGVADLLSFAQLLATAQSTGIPLADSLEQLARRMPPSRAATWGGQLATRVAGGHDLGQSVAALDGVDPLLARLVAATPSGSLGRILAGYSQYLVLHHRLAEQLRTALLYPLLLLWLAIGNLAILNGLVFPLMAPMFGDHHLALPALYYMLYLGDPATWPAALLVPGALVWLAVSATMALWVGSPTRLPHTLLGRLFGLPTFARLEGRSRIQALVALFLSAGRPLAEAVSHAAAQGATPQERRQLEQAGRALAEGMAPERCFAEVEALADLAPLWPSLPTQTNTVEVFRFGAENAAAAAQRFPDRVEIVGATLGLLLVGGVVTILCIAVFGPYFRLIGGGL